MPPPTKEPGELIDQVLGATAEILGNPTHGYTLRLISAIPGWQVLAV
ncbi:hypothetical protein ACFQ36_04945 [Arthrobacter sp. GCM10027362]